MNILYNEVPGYKKGDWQEYARHNDKEIAGFFGEYRWLSNFHTSLLWFEGLDYLNVECAFQSAKFLPEKRKQFQTFSATEAKKYGRSNKMELSIDEWNSVKLDVMSDCIFSKFAFSKEIREKLLATEDKYLEETNNWGDSYWGVCNGVGENHLGKILMATRNYWKSLA